MKITRDPVLAERRVQPPSLAQPVPGHRNPLMDGIYPCSYAVSIASRRQFGAEAADRRRRPRISWTRRPRLEKPKEDARSSQLECVV